MIPATVHRRGGRGSIRAPRLVGVAVAACGGAAAPLLATCTRPAEERAGAETEIGFAEREGLSVAVDGGRAQVRAIRARSGGAPGELSLWAQAPVLSIAVAVDDAAAGEWLVTVDNAMPDSALAIDGAAAVAAAAARPTLRQWRVTMTTGAHQLEIAPPDAALRARFRFAAMADIQTALPSVDEVFARINAEPGVRFVVSMGDITEASRVDEYELFEAQLHTLDVPYYTTIGNHDIWEDTARFRDRFGRANVHFDFKGVAFSLLDSGSAGIDPLVYDWLDGWLDDARDRVHVFGTHYPPIDPAGIRGGSFRRRAEAERLLARLAEGHVDLTLYGHIHSYLSFENAGIPAYISGGGGARQERWDGIGRHVLVVEAAPEEGRVASVAVVRVD